MLTRRKSLGLLVVAGVIGLVSCGEGPSRSPDTTGNTSSTNTSTTEATTTTPGETTTTTAPATSSTEADPLAEAVVLFQDWVGALAKGETERAWELMAPSSQLAFGTYERFSEMRTGFAEGWGSWVAVEDPSYSLEEHGAGRTLLIASGTIHPEGHTEQREVGVPLVREDGGLLLSPFEEFGNVADGLEEEASGADQPPIPDDSGEGRRIYSNSEQRVWLVETDGTVTDAYLVSGKSGVPAPGAYEVFSKSEVAFAGHDDITMSHMVRFAHGQNLDIGFHAIPNDGSGRPLQTEEELGEFRSARCVRQSPGHAAALFDWAEIGTPVVVLS